MTSDEVKVIVKTGEGQRVEFKTSLSEENEGIRSLCAFAHSEGGIVFFGIEDDGTIIGVTVGSNTIENLVNKVRSNTSPPLSPTIDELSIDGRVIVMATIPKAAADQLFYAFKQPFIRIGKSNHVMDPEQQRARLLSGKADWSEETDRPRFQLKNRGMTTTEASFHPAWEIQQVSGDYLPHIDWRIRGPRFYMEWQPTTGYALKDVNVTGTFNLSGEPREDSLIGQDEMAVEIRFQWHGEPRGEIHRWPIARKVFPNNKILWDVGGEILPPLYYDPQTE